ncbi:MAG TPA: STAS domain-containing protein [Aquihabitans sp.]|nr:STAS domain-containing protein [Aquihabitans sp.]
MDDHPNLDLRVERTDDGVTIHVAGSIDISTAPQLAEVVDAEIGAGAPKIVLDGTDLEFMDSTGISVLVKAWQAMQGRATMPVVVRNLRPSVIHILEVCGIHSLVTE